MERYTISIRVAEETLTAAEELIPVLQKDPTHSMSRVTRASVLRLAAVVGLEVLKEKYDKLNEH